MAYVSTTHERDELGGGRFRSILHLRPVAFDDAGTLRRIVSDWADSGDGTRPHIVTAAPFLCSVGDGGMRRIHPTREADVYAEIGRPYNVVTRTPFPLNALVRDGNKLTSTNANVILSLVHVGHFVKLDIELLNGWMPPNNQVAFPVALQGLTRDPGVLYKDGVPVMRLRPLIAYDAANPIDERPIAHDYVTLGGQVYLVLTLPDLTGMARPVIDPTYDSQPDEASGLDTAIVSSTPTSNYGTSPDLYVGERKSATITYRSLIKFDLSTITAGSTVSSATLSLWLGYAGTTYATNNRTLRVYRVLQDWVEPEATWNIFSTGNNWGTAGCSNTTTDREATSIGSTNMATTDASGSQHDFSLSTSAVQEWLNGTLANYGLLVQADVEEDDGYIFRSSTSGVAAQRPRLVIEWTAPAAGGSILLPMMMHHGG